MSSQYTLITGARQGIGRALAYECASRRHNLVLVSLPNDEFHAMGKELSDKYDVDVRIVQTDLSLMESYAVVHDYCTNNDLNINILINNVGAGFLGSFLGAEMDRIDRVINLNVHAGTKLTRLFLPELKRNTPAYVLNVASLAAYYPIPNKSIYSASKAYMYYFSRALRQELWPMGISVSVLLPGPVPTNQNVKRANSTIGFGARLSLVEPDDLAKYAIDKLLKKKAVIIPGAFNRTLVFIQSPFPPGLLTRCADLVFRKTQSGRESSKLTY